MARYRGNLPQLQQERIFLTDGGLETSLVFLEGIDLPLFAAFHLMKDEPGRTRIRDYFRPYVAIAGDMGAGFILESPTWRANRDWAEQLGYDTAALARINRDSIALMEEVREAHERPSTPFVISGCIGPRGDGYRVDKAMNVAEARAYHAEQVDTFASSAADMVSAITMTYPEEAAGIALAAAEASVPAVISFTTETDGCLPNGASLESAIAFVDEVTGSSPAYYMVNCAHPDHFGPALDEDAAWVSRLRGIRANASRCSHAELDNATELDAGNPEELGAQYRELLKRLPRINVLGGCCGTDHRHIREIAVACVS